MQALQPGIQVTMALALGAAVLVPAAAARDRSAQEAEMHTTRDFGITKTSTSPYCELRSVDLGAVRWTHGFWAEQFKRCREVTLPHLWDRLSDPETGHALTNLRIAAGLEQGEFAGTNWQDEWVYKWLEAAAHIYGVTGDEALDRRMDETIDIIAKAQQPDGYIATQITVRGWERFQDPRRHELYVMGHLIAAACIHHRITGKANFLDIARKAGDYLYDVLKDRPPALAHFPINPSIIMAAVELYRTTGQRNYLELANAVIDMRGAFPGGGDLNQDHVPLREEQHVVGHAVFYTYLYAGAADAYMETGDESLLAAVERLWSDLTEKKLYLTGGTCAIHQGLSIRRDPVHEAAGAEYFLPSSTAYNETCGQIGSVMWNWRMLGITGDARYADLMEQQLYNSVLSGIGLDGASWFYTNPLRWHGADTPLLSNDAYERFQPGEPPRRAHICCPSNLVRTIAGLHGYAYSASEGALWVNHYGANVFDGTLPDGTRLKLTQETDYPWDGDVTITMEEPPAGSARPLPGLADPDSERSRRLDLMLRIPAWTQQARVRVNGKTLRLGARPGTYARVRHKWAAGDQITLTLPMKPRLIEAHPRVEHLRNQVAVMRGPIVYCLESPDLPEGVRVSEIRLPRGVKLTPRHDPNLLGGVTVLTGDARRVPEDDWAGRLYRPLARFGAQKVNITLIPYYAWANRGISHMTVWMPLY